MQASVDGQRTPTSLSSPFDPLLGEEGDYAVSARESAVATKKEQCPTDGP